MIGWFFELLFNLGLDSLHSFILNFIFFTFAILILVYLYFLSQTFYFRKKIEKSIDNVVDAPLNTRKKIDAMKLFFDNSKMFFRVGRVYKEQWENFYTTYNEREKKGILEPPDIYMFFDEETLTDKILNRHFTDSIPGLFLSFGILGTLIGLTVGLTGLDFNGNNDSLLSAVGVLINGMQVAFQASILGIIFSLLWQIFDKLILNNFVYLNCEKITSKLDIMFPLKDQNALLDELANKQEEQLEDLKTFFNEVMIEKLVNGITENSGKTQMDGMENMVDNFVTSIQGVTTEHIGNLGEALKKTTEWQENVYAETNELIQAMNNSANKQTDMINITSDLTEKIKNQTTNMIEYQASLEKTLEQINSNIEMNDKFNQSANNLLENIVNERNEFNHVFTEHSQTLRDNLHALSKHTDIQNALNEKQTTLFENISPIVNELSESLSSLDELSGKFQGQLKSYEVTSETVSELLSNVGKLGGQFKEMQKEMQNLYTAVTNENTIMQKSSNRINDELLKRVDSIDQSNKHIENLWITTQQLFKDTNNKLENSMNTFSSDMQKGLKTTFDLYDTELSKAMSHLGNGVEGLRSIIMLLPDSVDEFNENIKSLNLILKEEVIKKEEDNK